MCRGAWRCRAGRGSEEIIAFPRSPLLTSVFPLSKKPVKMAGGLGLRSRPLRGLLYEPVTLKPVFSEEIAFYFLGRGGLAARLQQSPKTQCLGVLGAEARGAVRRASGLGGCSQGRRPSPAAGSSPPKCGLCVRGDQEVWKLRRRPRGLSVFSFCAKLLLQSGAIKPARDTSLAVPAEGWHGIFYVSICVSLYVIHGLTQGTREGTRVKFRSYLILQDQAFDAGCRQRLPPECSPDGNGSGHVCERAGTAKPRADGTQVRLGTAESKG